jgi:hypothetical protein
VIPALVLASVVALVALLSWHLTRTSRRRRALALTLPPTEAPASPGPTPSSELRFTAPNLWALDAFCASLGQLENAMPELRVVRIDLRNVPAVDASSLAAVHSAVVRLKGHGVALSIRGCAPLVAAELLRSGLPVEPSHSVLVVHQGTA